MAYLRMDPDLVVIGSIFLVAAIFLFLSILLERRKNIANRLESIGNFIMEFMHF